MEIDKDERKKTVRRKKYGKERGKRQREKEKTAATAYPNSLSSWNESSV
jgi:hypothetical protein